MYREQDPKYRGTDRTLQEKLNANRSDNPPSLDSNPSWEGEFSNLDVIQYLEDDEIVTDGGRTPEDIFDVLYEEDTNCPEYAIASGEVFDYLTQDVRASNSDALQVTRKIQKGEVSEAEKMFNEMIEGEV